MRIGNVKVFSPPSAPGPLPSGRCPLLHKSCRAAHSRQQLLSGVSPRAGGNARRIKRKMQTTALQSPFRPTLRAHISRLYNPQTRQTLFFYNDNDSYLHYNYAEH